MIHPDLPLIALHRHFEGNVRLATVLDLSRQHNLPLPADTLESLRPHIQVTNPNYADHPLKSFLEWGLLATINNDDPGISPLTLEHEYTVAAKAAGLTPEDTRLVQENALAIAFLSREEKRELGNEI
jgi:adenosine deaminase